MVGGEIEQRSIVQQGWKGDARVVEGQAFGLAAGRANAPDVRFVERVALDEVDECAVMRPDGKVAMDPGPRNIDLTRDFRDLLVELGDEHGIAFRWRVIHDAFAVGRPVELGDAWQVGPKRAAHRRNRPPGIDHRAPGGIRYATPEGDERPVWRKAESAGSGIPQLQHPAFGEIV